jgi:hypothetical protein
MALPDTTVDTVGEFVSGVRKTRIRPPSTPHLAQLPAKRPTAGIRQQYPMLLTPRKRSDDQAKESGAAAQEGKRVLTFRSGPAHVGRDPIMAVGATETLP